MNIVGLKEIKIGKFHLPKDFPKRRTSQNVKAIKDSLNMVGGIIHPPVVRVVDGSRYEVITGGDRVAAAYEAGQDRVICLQVEADDKLVRKMRIIENTHRRFDAGRNDRELEQLQAYIAEDIALEVQAGTAEEDKDRPITAARERIAAVKGVTTEAVRKAQQRAKKRVEKAVKAIEPVTRPQEKLEIELKTFGLQLDRMWLEDVGKVQRLLTRASEHTKSVKGLLTQIQNADLPIISARLQNMVDDVRSLDDLIRSSIPGALCPYCKGQPELQPKCTGCFNQGYIAKSQEDNVPAILWNADNVLVDGEVRLLAPEIPEGEETPQAEDGFVDPWA